MNFGSLTYLLVPSDVKVVTTKGDIEGYVKQRICAYLDLLIRNDCFQRIYDGSDYDSAIKNVREYIDEVIEKLRGEAENESDEGDEGDMK